MDIMILAYFHGAVLALGLILPLGVQNAFILNQGASSAHYRQVLPVVITAGISDTFLILLAVLGASIILFEYPVVKTSLMVFGIIFLVYIGYRAWVTEYNLEKSSTKGIGWSTSKKVLFTLSVSLLNPHAVIDTVGVIGPTALIYELYPLIAFTAAVIINSWLWFFALAKFGQHLRRYKRIYQYQGKFAALIMWFNVGLLVLRL